jgi:prepilin-type N-terminal cleavage/methylation domain-containing protein
MKRNKKKFGFTLVELLISISIIAILSIVLTISFSNAQKNGRDQRRISDLKAVQNAAEQMILLSGTYPVSVNSYKVTSPAWSVGGQVVFQSYPKDPKNTGIYVYTANGVGATGYCVCAVMEVSKNSNAESTNCSFVNATSYYCVKNQQ